MLATTPWTLPATDRAVGGFSPGRRGPPCGVVAPSSLIATYRIRDSSDLARNCFVVLFILTTVPRLLGVRELHSSPVSSLLSLLIDGRQFPGTHSSQLTEDAICACMPLPLPHIQSVRRMGYSCEL